MIENRFVEDLTGVLHARKQYEELFDGSEIAVGGNGRPLPKIVHWEISFFQRCGGEKMLVVPLSVEEELYTKLEDGTALAWSDITFLLVRQEKAGLRFEFLTKVPDLHYWLSDVQQKFTGQVLLEDIDGRFIKGYDLLENSASELRLKTGEAIDLPEANIRRLDWHALGAPDEGLRYHHTAEYYAAENCEAAEGEKYGLVGEYGGEYTYVSKNRAGEAAGQWHVGPPQQG